LGVMNIFRFLADLSHLLAAVVLFHKIWRTRSCEGISGRSQALFAIVFTARYLDLFTNFVSPYNTVMKMFFLGSSFGVCYLMWFKFKATYDRNNDIFRMEFLAIPTFLLALVLNHEFTFMEVMWTWSIYLEAVAIMPQLFMLTKTGNAETITAHYLFALGLYRALYIVNWIYRYYTENFFDIIAVIAGIVQTVLYADFFYLYVTKVINARKNFEMPA
ncbi:hypothetical protein PENTCL1PPCAC_28352, partial [Pristionchus entomophagus]